MKMRVLITGLTGFIGAHVARYLVNEGHEVVGYDLAPVPERISDMVERIPIVVGDICDLYALISAMKRYEITHVVHLAYYLPEAAIAAAPARAIRINCTGTNNVLDAARFLQVQKVVYASTDAVCPQGPKEDDPVNPTTLYGQMKYFNEVMARHYTKCFGLDTVGLRFGVNYGPGGRLLAGEIRRKYGSAMLHQIFQELIMGRAVTVEINHRTTFAWQYVKDSARCFALALTAPPTRRRVFDLPAPIRPIEDLTDILERLVPGARTVYQRTAHTDEGLIVLERRFDIDPRVAREEFGYEPAYTLEAALVEMVAEEVPYAR